MICPNKQDKRWSLLSKQVGEDRAYATWAHYGFSFPPNLRNTSEIKEGIGWLPEVTTRQIKNLARRVAKYNRENKSSHRFDRYPDNYRDIIRVELIIDYIPVRTSSKIVNSEKSFYTPKEEISLVNVHPEEFINKEDLPEVFSQEGNQFFREGDVYPTMYDALYQDNAPIEVKEGVDFVFEQNPELANSVYEALGFINKQELENLKKQFSSFSNIRDKFKGNLKDIKNVVDFFTQVAADVNFYKPFTTDISEQRKKDIISGKATSYIWEDSFDNYRKTIEKSLNDELESEKDRYNYWFDNGVDFYTLDVESGKYYKYKSNATVTPLEKQYEVTKKEYYEALDNYKDDLKEKNIQEQEKVKENVLRQPFLEGKIIRLFDNHFVIVTNHTIKEEEDSFVNEIEFIYYDKFDYDRLKELEKQQITPQQKATAQQLYSQYLDTIFPNSKVKDIVYHVGYNNIEKFIKRENGIYFTDNLDYAKNLIIEKIKSDSLYAGVEITTEEAEKQLKKYIVILNSKNILKIPKVNSQIIKDLNKENFDTIKGVEDKSQNIESYVVFEPEQIHILGSKQDIENFAKFVKNSELGNVRDMENYMNSKSVDYIMGKLIQFGKIEKRC